MSGLLLKIIAYAAMIIDHVGYVFFPSEPVFRIIGRLAMPIFCFFIAEGVRHTASRKIYLIRLAVAAAISEIPYRLCFHGTLEGFRMPENVIVTLFFGALALFVTVYLAEKGLPAIVLALPCLAACVTCILFDTDWTFLGVMMIFVFYFFKDDRKKLYFWISGICIAAFVYDYVPALIEDHTTLPFTFFIHLCGILALIPIGYYNGKYIRSRARYLFYAVYPVHLIIIYVIRILIGNI